MAISLITLTITALPTLLSLVGPFPIVASTFLSKLGWTGLLAYRGSGRMGLAAMSHFCNSLTVQSPRLEQGL